MVICLYDFLYVNGYGSSSSQIYFCFAVRHGKQNASKKRIDGGTAGHSMAKAETSNRGGCEGWFARCALAIELSADNPRPDGNERGIHPASEVSTAASSWKWRWFESLSHWLGIWCFQVLQALGCSLDWRNVQERRGQVQLQETRWFWSAGHGAS